jgi:hypothetical protein
MARQALHSGATGFGFMTAAMGVGAVGGGLLVAWRGRTGVRPLAQGIALWLLVAIVSLMLIRTGIIAI